MAAIKKIRNQKFGMIVYTVGISLGVVICRTSVCADSGTMTQCPIKSIIGMVICPCAKTFVKITVPSDPTGSWGLCVVIDRYVSLPVTIYHLENHSVS